MLSRPRSISVAEGLLDRTRIFHESLQVPHDFLGALPVHRMATVGVYLQGGVGDFPRTPLLFFARGVGVVLPPHDQRRCFNLAKRGRICKHQPLKVITPDASWELEALGDHRLEELFWNRLNDRALLELPNELGRNGVL